MYSCHFRESDAAACVAGNVSLAATFASKKRGIGQSPSSCGKWAPSADGKEEEEETYRSRRRQESDGGRPHEHRGPHVDASRIPRCLHAAGASAGKAADVSGNPRALCSRLPVGVTCVSPRHRGALAA